MSSASRLFCLLLAALAFVGGTGARTATPIEYWMWDSNQLPAYQAAARAFEAKNPDVEIRIMHVGWDDYWISLTTALLSNAAPDVFVNHCSRFPELARHGTLLDLAPFIARDGVAPSDYIGDLFHVWGRDGRHYGLPKDWDTVALVYNRAALARAGVDSKELEQLDWNPTDGGGFARVLARLTRDAAGEPGDSPRFDPNRVVQHGLLIDGQPDGIGQLEWSHFAASNGFRFYDGPWSKHFHYDDPRLAETFRWLRETSQRRRWIVPARDARQIRANGLFAGRRGALSLTGSWMIDWYVKNCAFEIGFAPLPVGPQGRKSMFNGLADTVWRGTRHPEEAWRWVRFLGSREGQMIIADRGVIFPAIREAAERSAEVMKQRGVEVSVFIRQATTPDGTFPYPITDYGSDLRMITRAAMDDILLGEADIGRVLEKMHRDVNQRLARPD